MKEHIFNAVLNHPWKVLFIVIALVIGASVGSKNLMFESDYRVFFTKETPELKAFEAMQKIYSKSDNVAFVLAPPSGNVFTKEYLEAIHWLTQEAWQLPYSNRIDSITNYQHTIAQSDDLIVSDLVLDPKTLTQSDITRIRETVRNEPLLLNRLVSANGNVTVVNATVQLPGIMPVAELPQVAFKAREIREKFLVRYPNFTVHLSGLVMLNNAFNESSQQDSATLTPLMFILVVVGLGFLLRTIVGTIGTVIVAQFAIMATMGTAGWIGLYLTGVSAIAPTIILTLAVADCIHILSTLLYEMRRGIDKREALFTSLSVNFQPICLTSCTTAIGFLSMNFSDSPPFHDLGNMVAYGVVLAFIFSMTILPALLMILPVRVKPLSKEQDDIMYKLADWVIGKRKLLLPVMTIVIALLVIMAPRNELNDNFVEYFDTSVPFRQATDFMQDNLSGMRTIDIDVISGRSGGVNDPAFLNVLDKFTDWLRQQPETDHVNTITDMLKRLNKNMHGDDETYYRLAQDKELSAQYLLLYEMSLPYGLDLNNQLNVDKSSTRITGTFKNLTSNEQIALEKRIEAWFQNNAASYDIRLGSPSLMFSHIGQRNINSMLIGTAIALILISVLMGIALCSVRYGLISLIPNLAPAASGFGLWYFIEGEIGLALSVVAGMTLGIVVDDTVHFLSKYLHARRYRNCDSHAAVHYAFGSVGRALWITTLVLVAGFLVLAQSTFKFNAAMGLLTAVTISIALIVDFLFLPSLLMAFDKPSKKPTYISGDDDEIAKNMA